MITIYQWDEQRVFVSSLEVDPEGPLPPRSTLTAPPAVVGSQVARWGGTEWRVMAEYPTVPGIDQTIANLQRNNAAYTANTLALTADYPQLEKDTWPTQDAESAAWVADPGAALTPWVDQASTERGIDREEYLRRTLVKAKQFKVLSSFLTGRRQKYEDAIKSGEDPVLDYALTPVVLLQLQQVATDGMNLPTEQLSAALAGSAQLVATMEKD